MTHEKPKVFVEAAVNDEDEVRTFYELPESMVARICPPGDTLTFDQALEAKLDAWDEYIAATWVLRRELDDFAGGGGI